MYENRASYIPSELIEWVSQGIHGSPIGYFRGDGCLRQGVLELTNVILIGISMLTSSMPSGLLLIPPLKILKT